MKLGRKSGKRLRREAMARQRSEIWVSYDWEVVPYDTHEFKPKDIDLDVTNTKPRRG
jgi:hypothetical protein